MNRKAADLAMIIGTVATVCISSFGAFAHECETLGEEVFRLHILANSDSEDDQQLKYKLRDYILEEYSDVFSNCENKQQAVEKASASLAEITDGANSFIAAQGYDYTVTCETVNMYFTTRVYENLTMPAGNYDALRIKIGKGEGKNWWCVMFPPLCLPAALFGQEGDEEQQTEFFTEEQSKVIENGGEPEIKFAIFEFFAMLFGWNKPEQPTETPTTEETTVSAEQIS